MSDTETDTNEPQIDIAEAVAEPEAEGPAEPEPEAVAEPEAEPEAVGDVADAVAEPEPEAVAEPEAEAPAEPEPEAVAEPEAEPEAVGDVAEADAVAEPEPEAVAHEASDVTEADAEVAEADVEADAAPNGQVPAEADIAEPGEAAGDVITDEELLERAPAESPYDRPGRWFVVHTQSGYEKKVKQNLEARIVSMNAEDSIYEVVIPMEDYVDFRNGKRIVAQRKMFPGYLLVRAALDDQAWFVIRNTPGVTGFVGQGAKPSPLPRRDVESFLVPKGGTEEQVAQRAKPRLEYEIGETVRVKEGPFADFSGEVIELNEDQLKLKVLVNIFGRETPVELEFSKVAKL
jgi:transcription termination/antitermination protein NusG